MVKQEELLAIRNHAKSLQGEERADFINRFNAIKDDDGKVSVLASRINGLEKVNSSVDTPDNSSNNFSLAGPMGLKRKDQIETLQGILEGATGGIARGVIEGNPLDASLAGLVGSVGSKREGSGIKIPRGNFAGQAIGMGLGSVIGPQKIASEASSLIKGEGPLKSLARGVTAGGIEGFLLPTENSFNAGDRIFNTIVGAGIGGAANSAIESTSNFIRDRKLFKLASKKLKDLDAEKFQLGDPNSRNAVRLREIEEQKKNIRAFMDSHIKKLGNDATQKLNSIKSQIDTEAVNVADSIKPKLSKSIREFKKNWGDRWDNLLSNSKSTTKVSDLISEIDNVENDIVSRGMEFKGRTSEALINLRNKLEGMMKASKSGLSVSDPIIQNADLVNELRSIKKSMSSASYTGGQAMADDIAGITFYRNMSDKLKNEIAGMGDLYKEYHDFKNTADFIYKKFSPEKESVNSAVRVLKNLGKNVDDVRGVEKIKDMIGGEDFTKGLKSLGDKLELERITTAENINKAKTSLKNRLSLLESESKSVSLGNKEAKYALTEKIRDVKKTLESLDYVHSAKDFVKFTIARGIEGAVIYNLLKLTKLGK